MIDWSKYLLALITGGRPMTRIDFRFYSIVTMNPVYCYEDYFGRRWLAEGSWSFFRVKTEHPYGYELSP